MLDVLLRAWLQNAAKRKLYEAASNAAREQMAGGEAPRQEQPARQRACDVGLVFASAAEAVGMQDRLEGAIATQAAGLKFMQGALRGRHMALIVAGQGREAVVAATHTLIAGHQPRWIISAGFASALRAGVKPGDIVMADELIDPAGQRLSLDLKVPPEALAATPHLHVGRVLTLDRPPRGAAEKSALGETHGALAGDALSFFVAEACREEKALLLVIDLIQEAVDDEAPADLRRLNRKRSAAGRLGAALGALVNRPSVAKDYLKQKESALVGADRLAKFLEGVILQLAPRLSS
jgi:adenosylhomocysteine nucleosidase